jgi:hypothetical protein
MDTKILIAFIILIPLLTVIGIAIGAFLESWRVTDRLRKSTKRVIIATATLLVLVCVFFLAKLSDIKISRYLNEPNASQTDVPSISGS